MKKIKNINTILIILIMLNYTFFSMFIPNDPTVLNEGMDFGKVSSVDFDYLYQIIDFDTAGLGYAVIGIDIFYNKLNLSYYDFNHHQIWTKDLGYGSGFMDVVGSDQRFMVLNSAENYYINRTEDGEPYLYLSNKIPNATIYDLDGSIVSTFSIDLTPISFVDVLNSSSKKSEIAHNIISGDDLFTIEIINELFLNNTYAANVILHSYNLITGQLNWKKRLTGSRYIMDEDDPTPRTYVFEYEITESSEQKLTIYTLFKEIILKQFLIKLDNSNSIDEIVELDNNFECVDYCGDDIILSFNEVVWVSGAVVDDVMISTLRSSNGPQLEFRTPHTDDFYPLFTYMGINFNSKASLTQEEMMLSGVIINDDAESYSFFVGLLRSDSEIDLVLFDLNNTFVRRLVKIDENTVLSDVMFTGIKTGMIILSVNKMRAIEFINPYYINILPGLVIIILIINISYGRYKNWKDLKFENYS